MAKVKPFKGLRPPKQLIEVVASRPYDVLSSEEARIEAEGNEKSLYHIIKPEIDFAPGTDEHAPEVYEKAVSDLKKRNIQVITHVILGLPNETREDMTATVDFAVKAGTDGIKLQLLHVLEGTDLCEDYRLGKFGVMSLEEYMDILFECIQRIPENVIIHRITGDAPKAFLVEPKWSGDKKTVMNTINREMIKRDIRQGSMVI